MTPYRALRLEGRPPREIGKMRQILPFLRPYKLDMVFIMLALTMAAAAVLAFGQGLRWLVDEGLQAQRSELLNWALLLMFGIIAVLAVATYFRAYLVQRFGEQLAADIRRAVFGNVLRQSLSFFEATRTGEVLSRLSTDTTILQSVLGTIASMAVRNVLLVVGGTAMMAVTSPKLTALTCLVVPAVVVPIVVFGRRLRRFARESQDRIGDFSSYAGEVLSGIETVQAFTHEAADEARFRALVHDALDTAKRRINARALLASSIILLVFSAVGIILWVGGHDMIAGRITAGDLSAFVFYAVVVAAAIGGLSEFLGDLQRAAGASERLIELIGLEPEIRAPAVPVPLPVPARGEVAMERVTFAYPTRPERAALDELSITVNPGERVALVGPSGAGKSTVFQMLLRFHDPQAGRVVIDGVDIREADPEAVRRRIGLVPQEPMIFAASIGENIRFGRPEASDADVRAAAEAAAIRGFIEGLPDGFDTLVGERGVGLSGGQRQRVAIARAILRDPAILLLDEATSSLDAESERAVQVALDEVMRARTTIVIAHRLATVQKADRIVVMDSGRVVAVGPHRELIEQDGLYARLAKLQFDDGGTSVAGRIRVGA